MKLSHFIEINSYLKWNFEIFKLVIFNLFCNFLDKHENWKITRASTGQTSQTFGYIVFLSFL